MRRRAFIAVLGAAVALPRGARAQQPPVPVVGFLSGRSPEDSVAIFDAFQRGLREAGFLDGQNIEVISRWARGDFDQLSALAADLVGRNVRVIVATGGGITSAQVAKAATATIPIVFVSGTDPVTSGLVASLNQPGGNLTGISFTIGALTGKRFELLHELVPTATVVGVLGNPNFPGTDAQVQDAKAAAQALGRRLVIVHAGTESELKPAFAALAREKVGSLLVAADPFVIGHAEQVVAVAANHMIAAIYPVREFAVAGGLMSYGTSITDAHREAGVYAGRILKGERPAQLPVLQPTKFELIINLKTASALGLAIPPSLLARADEVIE